MKKEYQHPLDTSEELLFCLYRNGIKLVAPDRGPATLHHYTNNTVKSVLKQPFNVYFLNANSIVENTNNETAYSFGLPSAKYAIGKSIFDRTKMASAQRVRNNDIEVLKTQKMKIADVDVALKDQPYFNALSIKLPWYDLNGQISGIFGCSVVLGKHPLADFMTHILQLGLLYSQHIHFLIPGLVVDNIYLSKREREIAFQLTRGKTASEIAQALQLSKRTVQNYIENMKCKLNVSSRSQLIERIIDSF
jgi:DNA-binding CsgD family transcriptional regulator